MKTTVIYHRADYDGLFCREAARHFIPDAEFIGWDFGDPKIAFPKEGTVYVLDLSPDCFESLPEHTSLLTQLVWIDHHKSSIEKWSSGIQGYRIDGVAACRLTWQWFSHELHAGNAGDNGLLPDKDDFVRRDVEEPIAIRLAGEYDIWDHRDPRALAFQFGLDTEIDCNEHMFRWMLVNDADIYVQQIVAQGKCAMECYRRRDAEIMRHRSFLAKFGDLTLLCLNTARCSSTSFAERDKPETGHDALCGFYWNGHHWTVSLYHAKHRTDIDLSAIAVKWGGGGHRGACGFTVSEPSFVNAFTKM